MPVQVIECWRSKQRNNKEVCPRLLLWYHRILFYLDLVGPYTVTSKPGTDNILTAVAFLDAATRWYEINKMLDNSGARISQVFNSTWLACYQRPYNIIFDNWNKCHRHFLPLLKDLHIKHSSTKSTGWCHSGKGASSCWKNGGSILSRLQSSLWLDVTVVLWLRVTIKISFIIDFYNLFFCEKIETFSHLHFFYV